MNHFKIEYNEERRHLKVYWNDKLIGGMIGKIAQERYHAIQAEVNKCDLMKIYTNGQNKAKKAKV